MPYTFFLLEIKLWLNQFSFFFKHLQSIKKMVLNGLFLLMFLFYTALIIVFHKFLPRWNPSWLMLTTLLLIPIFVQCVHILWAAVHRLVMIVLMIVMTAFAFHFFEIVAFIYAGINIFERTHVFYHVFMLYCISEFNIFVLMNSRLASNKLMKLFLYRINPLQIVYLLDTFFKDSAPFFLPIFLKRFFFQNEKCTLPFFQHEIFMLWLKNGE